MVGVGSASCPTPIPTHCPPHLTARAERHVSGSGSHWLHGAASLHLGSGPSLAPPLLRSQLPPLGVPAGQVQQPGLNTGRSRATGPRCSLRRVLALLFSLEIVARLHGSRCSAGHAAELALARTPGSSGELRLVDSGRYCDVYAWVEALERSDGLGGDQLSSSTIWPSCAGPRVAHTPCRPRAFSAARGS